MKKRLSLFFLVLIIIIIISIILITNINKRINPLVMDYSVGEMKRIVSIIINRSINSELLKEIDMDKLFVVQESSNEVSTITLDSVIVNKITDYISDACEDNLRLVEEGKYALLKEKFNLGEEYFFVPSGVAFNNTFLSNIGPKIPISIKVIGNVNSGINTEVKEYGINNSLINISVEIKVEIMVILPFSSDFVSITNNIPIVIKLIHGKVPQIYGGNLIK